MLRPLAVLCAALFLLAGAGELDAEARAGSKTSKTRKRSKRYSKSKRAKRSKRSKRYQRSKRRRARAKRKRRRRRRVGRLNMPRGWSWPPNRAMRRAGNRCLKDLTRMGVKWRRAPKAPRVVTPIYVRDGKLGSISFGPTWRRGPHVMDCHLARALAKHSAIFNKHGIVKLWFSQVHKFRTVTVGGRNRRNILSRHALGLAMDVPILETKDGQYLRIKRDYHATPSLRALELDIGKTPEFRRVISPIVDPKSHDDHFHFAAKMKLR